MLRSLGAFATVTVVPAFFPSARTLALEPDGVLLSNGPGDPAALGEIAGTIGELLGKVPVFGICLGHQLLGAALRGQDLQARPSGTTEATTRFAASRPVGSRSRARTTTMRSSPRLFPTPGRAATRVTHINLNDGVVEGFACERLAALAVQYHPEAGPGPHDARYLFEEFRVLMGAKT